MPQLLVKASALLLACSLWAAQPGTPMHTPVYAATHAPPAASSALPPLSQRQLYVSNIFQYPQLPNGCEGTSLAIVLGYYGFDADKLDMCYNYIPRVPFTYEGNYRYGADPDAAYSGDPATTQGFYCFAGPVAEGANLYLEEQGSALRASDETGATEEALVAFVSSGRPVIVWKTINNGAPYQMYSFTWIVPETGETLVPLANLHVVVLSGYDEENFYFCDPLGRTDVMERGAFMESFEAMGSRAVVLDFTE